MKIIILGSGFVSESYRLALEALGYQPLVLSRKTVDYTDPDTLLEALRKDKPDWVINCAGYTGETVDDGETNHNECYDTNVLFPDALAGITACLAIKLIHVSSGCVFDGTGRWPNFDGYRSWTEDDLPPPKPSYYARCKFVGEVHVRELNPDAFIFRIRMPFTHRWHKRNWLVKLANYPKILDGLNSVTWLDQFCMRSWQLAQKAEPGIYHAVQPLPIRTKWVAEQLQEAGLRGPFEMWDKKEFLKEHVQRSEAVLSCDKFTQAHGSSLTDAGRAIKWCIEQMKATQHEKQN